MDGAECRKRHHNDRKDCPPPAARADFPRAHCDAESIESLDPYQRADWRQIELLLHVLDMERFISIRGVNS
jgi:hypothetical protein